MRPVRIFHASVVAMCVALGSTSALAQDNAQNIQQQIDQLRREFEQMKQQYEQRLAALEAKAGTSPAAVPTEPAGVAAQPPSAAAQPSVPVPPGAEGAGGPSGALPVYGSSVTGS